MGLRKLARQLRLPYMEAEKFLQEYNEKIPFMKTTLQAASNAALSKGYVKTILNRRRRFNTWAPVDYALVKELGDIEDKSLMIKQVNRKIKEALDKAEIPPRPGIQRAYTYRALNAVIQGSAADLMKKAMVDCYEAGLYNILFLHLTVHDELDNSVPKTKEGKEAFYEQIHIMETAIKFKVPIIVDHVLAKNWGEVE
jgi:DNA polymerase-1